MYARYCREGEGEGEEKRTQKGYAVSGTYDELLSPCDEQQGP